MEPSSSKKVDGLNWNHHSRIVVSVCSYILKRIPFSKEKMILPQSIAIANYQI